MGVPLAVAGGLGVLQAITGVSAANQQAKSQQEVDAYQRQVALNDQQIAQQNASQATAAGEQQEAIQGLKTRNTVGAIKAAQGASGIDVNSGSAVGVQAGAAETGQLDALTIRANAARQAYGYETQGAAYGAEAGQDAAASENAGKAGEINEFSSLLGAASSGANQYAQWSRIGGGDSGSPF